MSLPWLSPRSGAGPFLPTPARLPICRMILYHPPSRPVASARSRGAWTDAPDSRGQNARRLVLGVGRPGHFRTSGTRRAPVTRAAPSDRQEGSGMSLLLAVDLGLRTGLALYNRQGRLVWYRSQNFGKPDRLRRAVHRLLGEIEGLAILVLEGGGPLAEIWSPRSGPPRHCRPSHRRRPVAKGTLLPPPAPQRPPGQALRRPSGPPRHRMVRRPSPHQPPPRRRRSHPHRPLGRARSRLAARPARPAQALTALPTVRRCRVSGATAVAVRTLSP